MVTLVQITFFTLFGLQIACALQVCNYNGHIYQNGDTFKSSDGCNTCTCIVGQVACTEMGCLGPACLYNGTWHVTGDTFNATDGCNTCNCVNGSVSCSEAYCVKGCIYNGQIYQEGDSFNASDNCNTCYCSSGSFSCTEIACLGPVCWYNGSWYVTGDTFNATDGCNTCNCINGSVSCTEMYCPQKDGCVYNGVHYNDGDNYDSMDGCNKCFCFGNETACTTRACITTPPPTPAPTCTYFNRVYNENQTFKSVDGCNTCFCQAGIVGCTEMACLGHVSTGRGVSCQYSGLFFDHGSSFTSTDGCNQCTCKQGTVHCTTYPCPTQVAMDPDHCYVKGKTYNVGDSYPAGDGCNACFCGGNNTGSCTEMFCIGPIGRSVAETHCDYNGVTYMSGDHFNATDGCNHCFCAGNVPVCTKMWCGSILPKTKRAVSSNTCNYGGHTYHAGEHFKSLDGCNTCGCSPGGYAFCTEMFCGPISTRDTKQCTYNGLTYQAGDSFKDKEGCNTCGCTSSGLVICTLMACLDHNIDIIHQKRDTKPCNYNGLTYHAGENFKDKDGCNSCGCTSSGLVFCTQMACLDHNINIIHQKRETTVTCDYEGTTYLAGQHFKHKDGCNTCSCSKTGQMMCTLMVCQPRNDVSDNTKREKTASTCNYEGATYLAGQRFMHNDGCNRCSCSKTGHVLCTFKACPPRINLSGVIKRETVLTCNYGGTTYLAGQRFMHNDGCNRCSCSKTGHVLCTFKACPPWKNLSGVIKRETALTCNYEGATYLAGQRFMHNDGCNRCSCSKTGHVLCTFKACPPRINLSGVIKRETALTCNYGGTTYLAGQRFMHNDGCNRCSCSKTGHVLCTLKACQPQINLSGVIKRKTACTYDDIAYQAGQRFKHKDGCNTCQCGSNGLVICTMMACVKPNDDVAAIKRVTSLETHTCHYNGKDYKAGQNFLTSDGCSTCGCTGSGIVCSMVFLCLKPVNIPTNSPLKRYMTTTTDLPLGGQVGGCHYGGQVYWAGESWGATDGCNSCYCSAHGGSLCTTKPCESKIDNITTTTSAPKSTDCKYHGRTYAFRDNFPDVDGCNTCYCAQNNFVECTKLWHCTFGTIGKR